MKISKEVKTGALVAVSVVTLFIGFYFLKGSDLVSNNKEYYCFYPNVDGLLNSANVTVRGMIVGHVSGMKLIDDKGIRVAISVNKNIDIPQGTTTMLELPALSGIGVAQINLVLGQGPGNLEGGATLPGVIEKGGLDNVSGELTPRLKELKMTIEAIDTAVAGINAVLVPVKAMAGSLASVSNTLDQQSGEIKDVMHNLNSFTANLASQNDTIKQVLSRLNNVSGQLANAPIQKTIADLQHTTSQLKSIMDKINSNEGTLGLLINNKDLYNNLNSSINSIQKLTDDLKAHPGRYVNINIIGKKQN